VIGRHHPLGKGGRRVVHAAAAVAVASGALTTLAGPALGAQAPHAKEVAAERPTGRSRLGFSVPKRIRIPSIGVNAKLVKVDVDRHGNVEVPPYKRHHVAGWYDRSSSPGETGSAVIVGHVDTKTGPSVFFRLKQVRRGAKILVDRKDHVTVVFRVKKVKRVAKARFPTKKVYGDVSYPALRVITCGGVFSRKSGHYLDNVIVFARLARVIDHRRHHHTHRSSEHRSHHGLGHAPDDTWDDWSDRRHDGRPGSQDEVRAETPGRHDDYPEDTYTDDPDALTGVDWATIGDVMSDLPATSAGGVLPRATGTSASSGNVPCGARGAACALAASAGKAG
jgi:hypothetical protein